MEEKHFLKSVSFLGVSGENTGHSRLFHFLGMSRAVKPFMGFTTQKKEVAFGKLMWLVSISQATLKKQLPRRQQMVSGWHQELSGRVWGPLRLEKNTP